MKVVRNQFKFQTDSAKIRIKELMGRKNDPSMVFFRLTLRLELKLD